MIEDDDEGCGLRVEASHPAARYGLTGVDWFMEAYSSLCYCIVSGN